jgi:hypothetical protein
MSKNYGIQVLPDGSAFCVGIVRDKPYAYPIVLWRNYRTAMDYSHVQGPQLSRWQSFRWAFHVTPFYFGGYYRDPSPEEIHNAK